MAGRVLRAQGGPGADDHRVARAPALGAAAERDERFADERKEDLPAPGAQLSAAGGRGGVGDEAGAVDLMGLGHGLGRADGSDGGRPRPCPPPARRGGRSHAAHPRGAVARGLADPRSAHGFAFARLAPDGATVTGLAAHLRATEQATSRPADDVVHQGYAERRPHPGRRAGAGDRAGRARTGPHPGGGGDGGRDRRGVDRAAGRGGSAVPASGLGEVRALRAGAARPVTERHATG